MQSPGNGPIRWESIAVGLISIATLLLGATAVVEVAQEFGAGGRQELNDFSRNFLRLLFLLNAFSYLIAWGFAFYTIFGETRRKRGYALGLAVCVFVQSMSIVFVAVTITIAAFR